MDFVKSAVWGVVSEFTIEGNFESFNLKYPSDKDLDKVMLAILDFLTQQEKRHVELIYEAYAGLEEEEVEKARILVERFEKASYDDLPDVLDNYLCEVIVFLSIMSEVIRDFEDTVMLIAPE